MRLSYLALGVAAVALPACAATVTSTDVTAPPDRTAVDEGQQAADAPPEGGDGLPTCGAEFVSFRWQHEGQPARELCVPVANHIQRTFRRDRTACTAIYDELAEPVFGHGSIMVGAEGTPFSAPGARSIGIALRGDPAVACGSGEAGCNFLAPQACRFIVSQAGALGELVEAHLEEPCALTAPTDVPGESRSMRVLALRVRSTLVAGRTLAAMPDSGPVAPCP